LLALFALSILDMVLYYQLKQDRRCIYSTRENSSFLSLLPNSSAMISEFVFPSEARKTFHIPPSKESNLVDEKYRAFIGISAKVTAVVWHLLSIEGGLGSALPFHLLWSLHFLKNYSTEFVNTSIWECSQTSIRKWTWFLIERISHLSVVRIEKASFSHSRSSIF